VSVKAITNNDIMAKCLVLTVLLFSSVSFGGPTNDDLKCYNEIHAPAKPVNFFGVSVSDQVVPSSAYSVYRAPLSTAAYLVTSKTILKKTFDFGAAEDLGMEPNPNGGGQVIVSASPIFEIDPRYTGASTKTYTRAKWSVTADHPNGARLAVAEVPSADVLRDAKKKTRKSVKIEKFGDSGH
jgi:hypothetical protein